MSNPNRDELGRFSEGGAAVRFAAVKGLQYGELKGAYESVAKDFSAHAFTVNTADAHKIAAKVANKASFKLDAMLEGKAAYEMRGLRNKHIDAAASLGAGKTSKQIYGLGGAADAARDRAKDAAVAAPKRVNKIKARAIARVMAENAARKAQTNFNRNTTPALRFPGRASGRG